MAWKVTFKRDTGDPKSSDFVGDATASFLDDKGIPVSSYSARIQSDAGVQDFITKAKAAKDMSASDAAANDQVAQKLENTLNG